MKIKELIKSAIFLLTCLISIGIWGCEEKKNENTITMGCSADYPPFEFRKNCELVGVELDLAKAICKKLGYSLEIKDMNFDGLIAALNTGNIDFSMSAFTVTEDRKKHIDFSSIYYEPKFSIMYRKDNVIDTLDKLKNKTIGVQLGTTMELFAKTKAKEIQNLALIALNKNAELIQELKIGRIDALIIEESQTEHFVKANNDLGHTVLNEASGAGYAIAFPKNSPLKLEFEKALNELKAEGELEKIFKKWSLKPRVK